MSALGSVDDGSEHAAIIVDNEVHRVQQINQLRSARPSRDCCANCDDEIPAARRLAVPGVQFCIDCQDSCDVDIARTKMVQWML